MYHNGGNRCWRPGRHELIERQILQSDSDDGDARLDAFQRIWAGERDHDALVQGIGGLSTLLVQEVLAQLEEMGTAEALQEFPA